MPEMSGFEVLKQIRRKKQYSHIPVMIMTAKHISLKEHKELKDNNIFQLVQKGALNKSQLLSIISRMIMETSFEKKSIKPIMKKANFDKKSKILVVEDNDDNMTTVKAILDKQYVLIEAKDGKEGIEQAVKTKPDIILMDISLPNVDGFTALTEIRKHHQLEGIPIIALTARALQKDKDEILDFGFDSYISKPIDQDALRDAIKRLLYGE